jgi:hypothetical protein
MSRRNAELAIAQTDASRNPRLILRVSASLNGTLKSLASIHDFGFDFDPSFDLSTPFVLSSTGSLDRIKREDCLSEASSAAPDLSRSAQSSRRPTLGAAFLWFVSFAVKRNELAH